MNEMFDRFMNNIDTYKKSEEEIKSVCEENQIPYLIFYDELSYRENDDRNIAKFLMKDNSCVGSKMCT